MPRWETGGVFMRFGIRDVLWLMVVVAVVATWVTDRAVVVARSNAKSAALQNLQKEYWDLRHRLDKAAPGWDDPVSSD